MGKKLTIFLVDGSETGPRTIEIGNWSGKAVYSQRSSLPKIIERQEFNRPGVYILKSMPNNDSYNERMYIGEAENLRKRLKQHLADSDRDFTEIVAFISKDEMLTKSHIKYLESRIITLAKEAKTAEIDNTVQPELTTLPEADISDMEYFLDQIKLIFPVVNFMFLVPSTLKQSENSTVLEQPSNNSEMVYTVRSKKVAAKLIETEKGYVVLSGSQSSKTTSNSISEGWIKQRNKLILITSKNIGLKNIKRILICTAFYHMRRCHLTFLKYAPSWIEYSFHPVLDKTTRPDNWWQYENGSKRVYKEVKGLIRYTKQGEIMDLKIE